MTYAEFAQFLDVPVTSAFDWESGKHEPPLKKLRKIAQRLNRSVAYLLGAS